MLIKKRMQKIDKEKLNDKETFQTEKSLTTKPSCSMVVMVSASQNSPKNDTKFNIFKKQLK